MTDPLLNSTLGKYQIQHRLGDGGMGSVYLAHNPSMYFYVLKQHDQDPLILEARSIDIQV